MRKIVLYIGQSLDGYIADTAGGVDWMTGEQPSTAGVYTYTPFLKTVDTIIMGWTTYHQIVTDLAPDAWPYPDQQTFVITHQSLASTENVVFTTIDPVTLAAQLKAVRGETIWINGGASVVQALQRADLIDVYHLAILPVILGSGTRLFADDGATVLLRLTRQVDANGIVEMTYERR